MEMRSVEQQLTTGHEILSVERRQRVRRSPLALTCVTLDECDVGIVANISETGMRVTSAQPLGGNCFSQVSIRLPQLYGAIETRAEIVWITASKKEAGVQFVDLPTEVREQIRMWVSLARGNREGPAKEEHPRNVEDGFSRVVPVAAMSPCLASGESVSPSRTLTEARRAELERMFPSENGATHSRDMRASKIAASSEPVAEAAPDAVSALGVIARELAFTNAFEDESALKAEADRNIDDSFVSEAPTLRARLKTNPLSPLVLEPSADCSVPTAFRTESGDFGSEIRTRRMWPVAALAIVLVVSFFALGFMAGPVFLQNWMKAQHPRDLSLEKLSRVKAPTTNFDLNNQNAANAAATPRLSVPASNQGAAPELPARTADENTSGNAAADESERGGSATSEFAERINNGASGANTPGGSATSTSEPLVTQDRPKSRSSKKSTFSANSSDNTDEIFDAAAPSEPASGTRPPNEKPHDAKPTASEAREMTSEAPAEEAPSSPAANAAVTVPAPAKTPTATEAPSNSLGATDSATRATNSSTHQPAPGDVPPTTAPAAPAPATPPVRTVGPAANAANAPQSFFPIVAPAAGSAPRFLELPPERVMDTVTVLIYSRQFVFVPGQPGPESSHKPEKVQMGERISNIEPVYPAQAAQKRMGGTVHLRATIGKDGAVESVKAIGGPTLLIPAAIDAVRQWRYEPTLLERQPIEMQEDITVEFRPLR
jgi:TonB family protein